jgi:hypothetical protein
MSKTILVSLSDIRNVLMQRLGEYWNSNGFIQPVSLIRQGSRTVYVSANHQMRPIADLVIETLLYELVTERQSDMRNAGQLFLTEKVLTDHSVDERTAHQVAEDLFADLVNTLGEHLPTLTFSNHDGFNYRLHGPDLAIIPKVV